MAGFAYASEKFAVARSTLMLPHSKGEAFSIAMAFHECALGLAGVDRDSLDDDARGWVTNLEVLMDTTGLDDPDGQKGLSMIKAEHFSNEEKFEVSNTIDTLAMWFKSQIRSS